jgi:hypothetical protein
VGQGAVSEAAAVINTGRCKQLGLSVDRAV